SPRWRHGTPGIRGADRLLQSGTGDAGSVHHPTGDGPCPPPDWGDGGAHPSPRLPVQRRHGLYPDLPPELWRAGPAGPGTTDPLRVHLVVAGRADQPPGYSLARTL